MKLNLASTRDVLIRCLQLCESKQELDTTLKFGDKILSLAQFPDESTTDRLNAMMAFLDEFHRVNERVDQLINM